MTATFTTPAIMSGAMIQALLDGRKTQTRRLPTNQWRNLKKHFDQGERCFVWVRESWQDYCPLWHGAWCGHGTREDIERDHRPVYKADGESGWLGGSEGEQSKPLKWKPSIHMPKWASRLTLEVTDVRLQQLQDIGADDCRAEGVLIDEAIYWPTAAISTYRDVWTLLHGKGSWETNPEVVAISFRVHRRNIDALLAERGAI